MSFNVSVSPKKKEKKNDLKKIQQTSKFNKIKCIMHDNFHKQF